MYQLTAATAATAAVTALASSGTDSPDASDEEVGSVLPGGSGPVASEMVGGIVVGANVVGSDVAGTEIIGGEMVGGIVVGANVAGAEVIGGEHVLPQQYSCRLQYASSQHIVAVVVHPGLGFHPLLEPSQLRLGEPVSVRVGNLVGLEVAGDSVIGACGAAAGMRHATIATMGRMRRCIDIAASAR